MEALDSFGEWLRRRREAQGLTRAELSACAGCSVSALRKIETDERRPSPQLAELLARCLSIDSEERSAFLDAARRLRPVARLGPPMPRATRETAPSLTSSSADASATSRDRASWNLPSPATPLIGREPEMATIAHLLTDPACRLLTLVGPGGIGKTRLAIEVACAEWSRFADGVYFASLAAISAPELIVPALAQAVGLSLAGNSEPRAQLLNHLRNKQLLLVLDNLEHLLEGVEDVEVLLASAPDLKLLVTSRERLQLSAEWVFDVEGLPFPADGQVQGLESYSAIQLFVQRAGRAHVNFELSAADYESVVRICRLVEGMPLAIELAAAWVRLLSCAEIASEIEKGLDFLAGTLRDVPPRQRSLRAAFDHSWSLLEHNERQLLSQLAIFRGGFERRAAEQIATASLPHLSALVDKSLLRRASSGRYDLHEAVRQYALIHLASDTIQEAATRDRHSLFYLGLLSGREYALRSSAQQQTLRELIHEIDNLRAAWAWAIKREMVEAIAPAVSSLGCLFELAGWLDDGIALMAQAIESGRSRLTDPAWQRIVGEALALQGLLLFRRGEFNRAIERMRESLELLRPLKDPCLLTPTLLFYGVISQLNGNLAFGQVLLEEALDCARTAEIRWYEAYATYGLGYIASQRGNYQQGYQQMNDGLALWRAIGDPRSIALACNFLCPTMVRLGYYQEAKALLEESLALTEQAGDRWGRGTAQRFLGLVTLAQGDIATARMQLYQSIETFSGFSTGWDIIRSLIYLGEADHAAGDLAGARGTLQDALAQADAAGATPLALDALAGLAALHLDGDRPESVLRLAGYIARHPLAAHEARVRANDLFDAAAARTTPKQISAAQQWAEEATPEMVRALT